MVDLPILHNRHSNRACTMLNNEESEALYVGTHVAEELMDYASHEGTELDQDNTSLIIQGVERGPDRARLRWITVEFIVVLVAASFGGMSSITGQYVRQRVSSDLYGNTTHMNNSQGGACALGNATKVIEDEIQQVTSQWNLYLSSASSLPSIFSTLLIGTLSERCGRRLPIILPCIGFLGQCIVLLTVVYGTLPLPYLVIGSLFSGISGGLSLFMAGCFSYMADITTEKQRMVRIVVIEILIFAGIGAMQIGLGYMIKFQGFARSLWIPFTAIVLSVINAAIPWLLIETVIPKTREEQGRWTEVFKDIIRLYRVKTENRRELLLTMIAISLLVGVVIQGGIAIAVLYGQGQPFCWESITIGFFITISLAIPGIGTVTGAGIFQWFKLSYLWIIQISILSGLANTLALACTFVIQSTTLIFASTFLGLFKLLGLPVIRTFLSTVVEKYEHGALFASLGVLDGISMFLASPMVNGIYYGTVDLLSTAVFFIMSALLIIPMIITGVLQCKGLGRQHGRRPLSTNTDCSDSDERLIISEDDH